MKINNLFVAFIAVMCISLFAHAQLAPVRKHIPTGKGPVIRPGTQVQTDFKKSIPVYLGTINITNSHGTPNFALSRFPNMALKTGSNVLVTPSLTNVSAQLINPQDAVLNDNDQVTLQATTDFDQANPQYFNVSIKYNVSKNSEGEYLGRRLVVTGKLPALGGADQSVCSLEIELNNLLSTYTAADFYYIVLNLAFDTSGTVLKLDSLDIGSIQNNFANKINTLRPDQPPLNDPNIYYQNCD
ncbi:MAG TPA: hypothetical protein VHO47_02015 [Candidatus Babeliales bacterium]|nr:hypothetical protein [Candidatus Babeliales bacterium]